MSQNGDIKMSASTFQGRVNIFVKRDDFAAAWDKSGQLVSDISSDVSDETDTSAWGFVVLVVNDDIDKMAPRHIVFWMGTLGKPPSAEAKAKVAWFEVKRSELNKLVGDKDYLKMMESKKEIESKKGRG